jgi:hypothetical protein
MPLSRSRLAIGAAVLLALAIAVAFFVIPRFLTSSTSDCDKVRQMLAVASDTKGGLTDLAIDTAGSPLETVQAYGQREAEMRGIADGIADSAIREKSRHLIDLDASIIDTWSKTVATPAPPGASDVETSSKDGVSCRSFSATPRITRRRRPI